MVWVHDEAFGLPCPGFAEILIRRQSVERLQSAREVVSLYEVVQAALELLVAVVVMASDGGFLDGAIHPLNLPVRPGVVDLSQAMLDGVLAANAIKEMPESLLVLFAVGKLNAVVREHGMDGVGQRPDQLTQELRGFFLSCAAVQFEVGELAGTVDGHEQIKPALCGLYFSNVDVEIPDGVALEFLSGCFVVLCLG
jgi:hypothetical protein